MKNILSFENKILKSVSGYAATKFVKSYVFYPRNIEECIEILEYSKKNNFTICCRGAGLSYVDSITNSDNIILDLKYFNNIISWDNETGIIITEPGTTFAQVLNLSLLSYWTISSCPGSMDITIGGAVSNNVHGKDSYKMGNFGKQVLEIKILLASGKIVNASQTENSDLFNSAISGMGLLGIIIEIKMQLKKISSVFLNVENKISNNIFNVIDTIEKLKNDYDFSVGWIDNFSKNNLIGRGHIALAKWSNNNKKIDNEKLKKSLMKSHKVFGILPAQLTWKVTRPFFNSFLIKNVNMLNFYLQKFRNSKDKNINNELMFTEYTFMHNKIPDLKNVFMPNGFLEFQPLLPLKNIEKNLNELILLCQKFKFESFLCGLKVHSSDKYALSFQKNGYSFGITAKVGTRKKQDILAFARELYVFTLECNGMIYLAKDEFLDNNTFKKMYPNYSYFLKIKNQYDPKHIFSSDLFTRLFY